jgi:hypothetical protein
VYSLSTQAGQTASGDALLLTPGTYHVSFVAQAPPGAALPNLTYALTGSDISDPIGPAVDDTTLNPLFIDPNNPLSFIYPDGTQTTSPFLLAPVQ